MSAQNHDETPLPTKIPTDAWQKGKHTNSNSGTGDKMTRKPLRGRVWAGRPRPPASSAAAQSALTFRARWRLRPLPARQEGLGQQQRQGQDEPRGQRHSLHRGVRHGCVPLGPGIRTGTGTAARELAHTRPAGCTDGGARGTRRERPPFCRSAPGRWGESQQQASIS